MQSLTTQSEEGYCERIFIVKEVCMRHPIWIFNSALFLLLVATGFFMFFTYVTAPDRESIEPGRYIKPSPQEEKQINIAQIYKDDLFGTYVKEVIPEEEPDFVLPAPEPPAPEPSVIPEAPKPQFLDPLKINLKGIIVVGHDESKNRAIIFEEKTSEEKLYKVEDTIEDAYVIKIFNNKVILLRSNGQQEVLYLREHDAKHDPTYMVITGWEKVIKRTAPNILHINPSAFLERVSNLAQFIDLLDLTTVYQKGKSIGCRIGKLDPQSLGTALGLRTGDIVKQINNIPATDTPNRFAIYQEIIKMNHESTISVDILRSNQELSMQYILDPFEEDKTTEEKKDDPEQVKKENIKMLQQKHSFAPTINELRKRERHNMLERGKEPKSNMPSSSE